jgi:formiminotetrahydrofolate cyclodeaminase
VDPVAAPGVVRNGKTESLGLRDLSVSALLREFAAGNEVPGSGSANALAAAVAACLACSVAVKTHKSHGTKYVHVQQTAIGVERRAKRIGEELLNLVDEDSAAFAPVIAIRRQTGRVDDPILQDASLRKEVAALKPATDIPLRIATLAIDVGHLAITMLESGFDPARGESYTALAQAIAAIDGALFVAQLNVRKVRKCVSRLHDPELEADWIQRVLKEVRTIREHWRRLRVRKHLARRAQISETFASFEL